MLRLIVDLAFGLEVSPWFESEIASVKPQHQVGSHPRAKTGIASAPYRSDRTGRLGRRVSFPGFNVAAVRLKLALNGSGRPGSGYHTG